MEFELINPSDPYTFIAADYETAALTVFCLGTQYGAATRDNSHSVPVMMFGGGREWYMEKFGRNPDDGLNAKYRGVSDALASMMLGGYEDRRRYNAALEAIDDDGKRKKFIEEWQDGRSSMNDIGTYSHRLAESIMEKFGSPQAEDLQ